MRRFSVALLAVLFLSQSLAGPLQAAGRRFLAADSSKKTLALIDEDGQTVWQHRIGPLHDLHQLADGHILCQLNWTRVVEIDPATDEIVWEYDAATANGNEGKKVEVHAFQRLVDGNTMIVESGPARIIEVAPNGQIAREIPLKVENPHPHRDTRLVRKLDSGNYLVCHEGDGVVREYDATGAVVWDFAVPLFGRQRRKGHGLEAYGNQCFAALRLKNGNTLISTGNGHGIIEVTPAGKVVWQLQQDDLPGIRLGLGHHAGGAARREHRHRQLSRRSGQPAADRDHPRQGGGLDVSRLQAVRQCADELADSRHRRQAGPRQHSLTRRSHTDQWALTISGSDR